VQKVKSMDNVQRSYSLDDEEFIYLYFRLGAEGTKSNEEPMNLVETVKVLPKDVHSCNVDNERLMRVKAQYDDFNFQLMQSMKKIENKMDKETESSRSRSHRSHVEKRREERSVGKHSFREELSSSSPSPIRKNKRRNGVDEIKGEMNNIKPPTFYGEHKKDKDA
jgi:hypothetical protein